MAVRKYFTEFGLSMCADLVVLLQQDSLDELDKTSLFEECPCHIYMICRRPRLSLDPDSFYVDNKVFQGYFNLQRENSFEKHQFVIPHRLGNSKFRVECPYPHTEFSLYDQEGEKISLIKVGLLAHASPKMQNLVSLEVLYIGQSYGVEGARKAPERLKSHSTLQGIYFEAMKRSPDQEIWLILLSFKQVLYNIFYGDEKEFEMSDEEDDKHIEDIFKTGITEQQRINFTEAALIRYFEPKYNKIFKDTFPNPAHTTYSECYELDLNAVMVELCTETIGCMIKSDKILSKWTHIVAFPLHDAEKRKSMFNLSNINISPSEL